MDFSQSLMRHMAVALIEKASVGVNVVATLTNLGFTMPQMAAAAGEKRGRDVFGHDAAKGVGTKGQLKRGGKSKVMVVAIEDDEGRIELEDSDESEEEGSRPKAKASKSHKTHDTSRVTHAAPTAAKGWSAEEMQSLLAMMATDVRTPGYSAAKTAKAWLATQEGCTRTKDGVTKKMRSLRPLIKDPHGTAAEGGVEGKGDKGDKSAPHLDASSASSPDASAITEGSEESDTEESSEDESESEGAHSVNAERSKDGESSGEEEEEEEDDESDKSSVNEDSAPASKVAGMVGTGTNGGKSA